MIFPRMVRISPVFTCEAEEERAELLRTPPFSSTPFPFKADSTYIPPESSEPIPKVDEPAPEKRSGLWSSIALRFGGFTANLKAAVEPLNTVSRPGIARNFFANRLSEAAELSSRNPGPAYRTITRSTKDASPLWRNLLLVGCGDGSALAPALAAIEETHHADEIALADCVALVARQQPAEGRYLVRHAAKYLGTESQLRMLKTLVDNETRGSTRLVGELFESIMENSTSAERSKKIYPEISRMVSEDVGRKSPSRGFLGALLSGWLSECEV
jgi:hypothetical protein